MSFKVGDWVRGPSTNTVHKLDNIEGDAYYDKNGYVGDDEYAPIELWQPKVGEWCWFYSEIDQGPPFFDKFTHIDDDGDYCSEYGSWYKYCEPFMGTLPTSVKKR